MKDRTHNHRLAKELERLATDRRTNINSGFQLSRNTKVKFSYEMITGISFFSGDQENHWPRAFGIMAANEEKLLVFKAVKNKGITTDTVEVVAHVQGIIWRHDLPPFQNRTV